MQYRNIQQRKLAVEQAMEVLLIPKSEKAKYVELLNK